MVQMIVSSFLAFYTVLGGRFPTIKFTQGVAHCVDFSLIMFGEALELEPEKIYMQLDGL